MSFICLGLAFPGAYAPRFCCGPLQYQWSINDNQKSCIWPRILIKIPFQVPSLKSNPDFCYFILFSAPVHTVCLTRVESAEAWTNIYGRWWLLDKSSDEPRLIVFISISGFSLKTNNRVSCRAYRVHPLCQRSATQVLLQTLTAFGIKLMESLGTLKGRMTDHLITCVSYIETTYLV